MGDLREKLSEDLIIKLLKQSEEWLETSENKDFSQIYTFDVLSIISSLFYRREFQFMTPYQHDVSKLVTKILIKVKQYPLKWKKLKKIKAIIDRWGETVPEDCVLFPIILDKFLNTYFTPGVSIKVRNYNLFHPMFASRAFLKFLAN